MIGRRINYTWPRRLHVIRNEHGLYLTLIASGRRLHLTLGPDGLPDEGLWQ
jgi:hypothetical protein